MKQIFKCDYCSKMGIEEEIREHELECTNNYDRRSCFTCIHRKVASKDNQVCYECKIGQEIPQGKIFEFCNTYEREEKREEEISNPLSSFLNLFK